MSHAHMHHGADKIVKVSKAEASSDMNVTPLIDEMCIRDSVGAVLIGVAQVMALVPGVSRSGATITAGMLLGLSRLASARFTFLLSVPAIGAAAAHEGLKLRDVVLTGHDWALFGVGFVASGVVGYLAVSYLLKFLVSHRLDVFAWYRIAVAVAILIWL